ncbi:MAG: hypothetical protein IPP38_01925 [Bacteroidetes bacterium]|nr:hypothetical protein [Bacteroidota bacterium]
MSSSMESGSSTVSGIGTWDLNTVTLNKSGSTTAALNVQAKLSNWG